MRRNFGRGNRGRPYKMTFCMEGRSEPEFRSSCRERGEDSFAEKTGSFGLQEGERLSYSVSVLQNDEGDEEDEPDPTAAASGDHGDPAIAVRGQGVADHAEQGAGVSNVDSTRTVEDVLPITGEKPAEMWDEINTSKPVVVANAESFVNTDNGKEAYSLWRQGKLTDRHIGNKYGYNVLGNFYGRRDWENGVFDDDLAAESAHGDARDPTPGASHGRPEEDVHGELAPVWRCWHVCCCGFERC